jgi:uncharacterized protein
MPGENRTFSRRDFIKAAGAAGLGSALGPLYPLDSAHAGAPADVPEQRVVPTRPFGKTGVGVSILSLGGVLKDTDQIVFRQAFKRDNVFKADYSKEEKSCPQKIQIGRVLKRVCEDLG